MTNVWSARVNEVWQIKWYKNQIRHICKVKMFDILYRKKKLSNRLNI